MSLRILHTESSVGWGGQEIRILSESQGLLARGHDVLLIAPREAQIFAEAPAWKVPVRALPIGRKNWTGFRALLGWLRRNPYDVVSTHSSTDSWLSALALQVLGRPFPMVRIRHVSTPVSTNRATRWLYESASSRIVTTGEALKRELVERNGFTAAKIESVPTGIDSERYRPGDKAAAREALKLPRQATLVGIVATLRDWKGHHHLVEAVAGLPSDVLLVMVGEGPQRAFVEGVIRANGMQDRIVWPGNQRDVLPWLQAMDVFALPSYGSEGVPQALLQAMAAGLPCVTTHVGSIAEAAIPERTALIVPPKDVAALRAAIARLVADAPLRERLGAAARAHVVAQFSYASMVDRMEAVYRRASGKAA